MIESEEGGRAILAIEPIYVEREGLYMRERERETEAKIIILILSKGRICYCYINNKNKLINKNTKNYYSKGIYIYSHFFSLFFFMMLSFIFFFLPFIYDMDENNSCWWWKDFNGGKKLKFCWIGSH